MVPRLRSVLMGALFLAALAQTNPLQASASAAPVAYVYVSAGSNVYAYATAADGTLTALGSRPTPNAAIWHLSVTKKFLYGIDGQSDIYMFAIGSHGALTSLGVLKAADYEPDACYGSGILQVDETESNLYAEVGDCNNEGEFIDSFKILPTGDLLYLGRAPASSYGISQIRFTSNNLYAFQTGCYATVGAGGAITSATTETTQYKRESNGFLTYLGTMHDVPEGSGVKTFCAFSLASHDNQLIFEYLRYEATQFPSFYGGDYPLGIYAVSADGKLSTKSDYANMAVSEVYPTTLSVSPSGAVLATGGDSEFQFFHYSETGQPVKWTGPFAAQGRVEEFAWDKADHFYALTDSSLMVYHITATTYKQEAGLPGAFTNAGSVIVLSLN